MKKRKNKRVLITGAAGFIGSNLSSRLVTEGYDVTGIDNLSNGYMRNIKGLEASGRFGFIKGDIRNTAYIRRKLKSKKFDYIVHLAAFKIPRYGNTMDTLLVNSDGTKAMLDLALGMKAKLVFASTSDVYGRNPEIPFREDSALVLGPSYVRRWAYASSKIFDEHLCFSYREKYGLDITILRFFGAYGPNQNLSWWGGPQSVFIDCAMRNKSMDIHGDGRQTRSFTFVGDTVRGIQLAMEKKKANGEIFNIGNNREIMIKDLADMIWRMVSKTKPKMKLIPYDNISKGYQDVIRRVPDISKSMECLAFRAETPLEKGLPITIEWQRGFTK